MSSAFTVEYSCMSQVCTKCFQDRIAKNFIKAQGATGDCEFCGSTNRKVLAAFQLRGLFEELIGLYRSYDPPPGSQHWGGETLAECLAEWEIFPEGGSRARENAILDGIMGYDPHDGDVSATEDWQAKSDHWTATPAHQQWPWFAAYLKRERRFIIEDDPSGDLVRPETWVPDLLIDASAIKGLTKHTRLFRGRLGKRSAKEMGAPPAKFATAGRANPAGISFLYCALDAETAIIETGRFPGAEVTLGELRAKNPLRLADLRGRLSTLEPLDTPNLAETIRHRSLLFSLGQALGEPVHPEDSQVEYIPTQYLAEVIRAEGYDGICYPSALRESGTNVVIFDPGLARITSRGWTFKLGRADYTIQPNPKYLIEPLRKKRSRR